MFLELSPVLQQSLNQTPKIKVELGRSERIFLVLPKEEYDESSPEVLEISCAHITHIPVFFL